MEERGGAAEETAAEAEEATAAEMTETTTKETTKEANEDTTKETTNGLTNGCRINVGRYRSGDENKNDPRKLEQLFKGL